MNLKVIAICLPILTLAGVAGAGKAPVHKSLRAYAMGNAFVAVAEDKEAVYYNPAGLNLINRLGNYEDHPDLGYYVHNFMDARINVGFDVPLAEAYDAYLLGRDLQELYQSAQEAAQGTNVDQQTVLIDSLGAHPEIADQLMMFDQLPINIATKIDFEAALPHIGGSIWMDGGVAPFIESGIITPAVGFDTAYLDLVVQGGLGIPLGDKISLGAGVKAAKRAYIPELKVSLMDYTSAEDSLRAQIDRILEDSKKFSTIGIAAEFGMLYQWKRDLRLGASLRNWFVKSMGDEKITPNLTAGIAYSPRRLQRNTGFFRKVNLAVDYEDMLNSERNYKPLSKLNMGMEVEQVLLAIPNVQWLRFLKVRGGVGFKGGYPSAGIAVEALRVLEVEFATWGEEAGYSTGAEENRFWVLQLSLGI